MILTKVTDFLKQNKKIMYYLGFFALIYFAMGDSVSAADVGGGATTSPQAKEFTFIEGLNYAFKLLSILLWIITNFVGLFLNPAWTNGTVLWLNVQLKELWILISNIVYFIFAILLVMIAFMNIIWKWEKWELKQALPKFIVWVLIVPFSWFFVQLILSFSSVMTASVLAIPYDILSKNDKVSTKLAEVKICTHHFIEETGEWTKKNITWTCKEESSKKGLDTILQWDSAFGILHIYTYGVFALDETKLVFDEDIAKWVKSITALWFKTIFNLLLLIVFAILVISLWLALFVRGVWLWIYMIFSPVFWLLYFFWKEKDGFVEGKFSITEFFALAFVPVYVAAALSFWLLFIFVAWEGMWSSTSWADAIFNVKTSEGSTKVKLLWTYTIEMWWTLSNSGTNKEDTINKIFNWFKGSLGTLIMQLFWLAVLWISVMAAISQSKITEAIVKPIADFWGQVGWLISKSPQYLPMFGWGQSIASLSRVWTLWAQHYANVPQTNANKFIKDKWLFGNSELIKLNDAITANTAKMGTVPEDAKAIKSMTHSVTDANLLVNSEDYVKSLNKALATAGITGSDAVVWNANSLKVALNAYEKKLDDRWLGMFADKWRNWEFTGIQDITDTLKKWVSTWWTQAKEWSVWFVDEETLKIVRDWKNSDNVVKTQIEIEGWKMLDVENDIWWTNMAYGEYWDKGERKLIMSIWDDGIWMDFSSQSKEAFDENETKNVSDLLNKIQWDDKKQLQWILNQLTKENRVEVFNRIFKNIDPKDRIIDKKDAAWKVMKDATGKVITETITNQMEVDKFMNSK